MIDINKKYRTRAGLRVELVTDRGREPYPLLGYVGDQKATVEAWTLDGHFDSPEIRGPLDLVEVLPAAKDIIYEHISFYSDFDAYTRTADLYNALREAGYLKETDND